MAVGERVSKTEEITYIVPFLIIHVAESAGLAVGGSLGEVPVVPHGGAVVTWGQRASWSLRSICLVLGA